MCSKIKLLAVCVNLNDRFTDLIGKNLKLTGKSYTGWPRKKATIILRKQRTKWKKLCALFFSHQEFRWRRFDCIAVFLSNVIYKSCPSISKVTIYVPIFFFFFWLPRVKCLLLLCKVKPAWILKRSNHYGTWQHYNLGKLSKKFLPTSNVTFDTRGAHFENDIDLEKWL